MPAARRTTVLALVTLGSCCLATPLDTATITTAVITAPPAPAVELPTLPTEEVLARADATVVTIVASAAFSAVAGTGFVVTPDGIVVTNFHVVENAYSLSVTHVGDGLIYDATVLGYDKTRDIAVLDLATAAGLAAVGLATVEAAPDVPPDIGDSVTAVGNVAGAGVLVPAPGAVTALDRSVRTFSSIDGSRNNLDGLIQVDADVRAGDSGGPLFDGQGKVIGVNTAGLSDSARADTSRAPESYAVPISDALAVVDQVLGGKSGGTVHVGRTPYLGVSVRDVNAFDDGRSTGAKVVDVSVRSPSESVGLVSGDIIEKVDDIVVGSSSDLVTALIDHYPGDVLRVTWTDRNRTDRTGFLTLGTGTPTA